MIYEQNKGSFGCRQQPNINYKFVNFELRHERKRSDAVIKKKHIN